MKKINLLSVFMLLFVLQTYAQKGLEVATRLKNFHNEWIKPMIPIIGALVLVVGALANLGKLIGEERDTKAFIKSIALYLGGYFALVAIIEGMISLA